MSAYPLTPRKPLIKPRLSAPQHRPRRTPAADALWVTSAADYWLELGAVLVWHAGKDGGYTGFTAFAPGGVKVADVQVVEQR